MRNERTPCRALFSMECWEMEGVHYKISPFSRLLTSRYSRFGIPHHVIPFHQLLLPASHPFAQQKVLVLIHPPGEGPRNSPKPLNSIQIIVTEVLLGALHCACQSLDFKVPVTGTADCLTSFHDGRAFNLFSLQLCMWLSSPKTAFPCIPGT